MTVETCQECAGLGICPRCSGWGVDFDGARCATCGADGTCPNPRCHDGEVDVEEVLQA